jgi:hypothetical protein
LHDEVPGVGARDPLTAALTEEDDFRDFLRSRLHTARDEGVSLIPERGISIVGVVGIGGYEDDLGAGPRRRLLAELAEEFLA